MIHDSPVEMTRKNKENKVKGFNVRILDDSTFVLRTDNNNYEMSKEYSFENIESLNKGIKMVLGKIENKNSDKKDMLENKKSEY